MTPGGERDHKNKKKITKMHESTTFLLFEFSEENAKKTKLTAKSLWRMQTAFFLEEKVGKGLGGGKILFSKVQKRS